MKQKNYKWVFYLILVCLAGTVLFLGFKDITPLSKHIEQDISINIH